MSDTKRRSRPVVQRVATNLRVRGGSYEFRKVIPRDARAAFGGVKEYVRSFGDITRKEAERLAAFHRAYCNGLIAEARGQSQRKTAIDLIRIKRTPEREEIERVVRAWLIDREAALGTALYGLHGRQKARDIQHIEREVVRVGSPQTGEMPMLTRWIAEALAEASGWQLPEDGELRRLVEDRVGRAQFELSKRITAEQKIGEVHQPTHQMFAPEEFHRDNEHQQKQRSPVLITELLERYLENRRPAAKTVRKWTTAITSLIAHLGHEDAANVTPEDIIGWKDALLAVGDDGEGRTGQTVRNGYIGAAKTVFGWGKRNRLIADNPVAGVTVDARPTVRNRPEKGFTEAEAKQVLGASLATDTDADGSFGLFARRWLPWLCAYTGARVGEMAQLRREDVTRGDNDVWIVLIKPEAGSQKGHFARQVPLHPHLIEQGFVEAAMGRSGPLFYDPAKRRKPNSANPQYTKAAQRVAEWVRKSVGITDPELQPNHGWRHRFTTVANEVGMPDNVCRAIIGHAAKDVHQTYGNVSVRLMHRWISRMPRYVVNEAGSVGTAAPDGGPILQPVATAAE
jgi:integrase